MTSQNALEFIDLTTGETICSLAVIGDIPALEIASILDRVEEAHARMGGDPSTVVVCGSQAGPAILARIARLLCQTITEQVVTRGVQELIYLIEPVQTCTEYGIWDPKKPVRRDDRFPVRNKIFTNSKKQARKAIGRRGGRWR